MMHSVSSKLPNEGCARFSLKEIVRVEVAPAPLAVTSSTTNREMARASLSAMERDHADAKAADAWSPPHALATSCADVLSSAEAEVLKRQKRPLGTTVR